MTSTAAKANGHHRPDKNSENAYQTSKWDDCLPFPALSWTVARAVIFVVSVVCFAVSYDGKFVFDDSEAIVGNKDLKPETPLSSLLEHDFWGKKLNNKSHKSYRPLTVLTYRWNYYIAGGLHPLGFHVVNILLHGVVSVLFLSAFSVLLEKQPLSWHRGAALTPSRLGVFQARDSVPKAALLSAVLFALHPVHTENVAGLVGRADLLCAIFFLLSFLSYASACVDEAGGGWYRPGRVKWGRLLLSVLCCFLATFSKEQGITVIGVCFVYDVVVVSRLDPLRMVGLKSSPSPSPSSPSKSSPQQNGHSSHAQELSPWVGCLLQRVLLLVTAAAIFLLLRLQVMGLSPPTFQVPDNPHSFVDGALYRGLNYNYLYSINFWLLLNPWWLCFDWSMGCVPTITSLADPRLVCVLVFWSVIGSIVFHAVIGEIDHEKRCVISGLGLLVIPFLPASNLLFRVGFVVAERNLYLPSAGFCLLLTLGAVRLSSFPRLRQIVAAGLAMLCVVFFVRCVHRSRHWHDELPLYMEGEKVCPLNGKVHYNIAKLQADRGETEYAIRKYRRAIELNPEYDQAMNNLANILKDRGDNLEAEALLVRAVTINPVFAAAWMNLGIVQAALNKYAEAEASYRTAISHRNNYPDCYYNLGNLYLEQKQHQEALLAWHNSTRLKPEHLNSWSNAIILLDNLGHQEQALQMGDAALKHLPRSSMLWFNVANVQGKLERWKESEHSFLTAIRLDNSQARYHLNLGVLYHRWGRLQQAQKAYHAALQLEPGNPSALDNLAMLDKKRQTA